MKRNFAPLACAALLALAVWFSVDQYLRWREAVEEMPPQPMPPSGIRRAVVAPATATLAARPATAGPPPPRMLPAKVTGPDLMGKMPNPIDLFAEHPDFQKRFIAAYRANILVVYGPFVRTLKLRPEEVAEFQDVLGKFAEDLSDLIAVATARGQSMSDADIHAANEQMLENRSAQLRAILGDDGVRMFDEYRASVDVQQQINKVACAMNNAEAPLSLLQANQLKQALMECGVQFVDYIDRSHPYTESSYAALRLRAAQILSAGQMDQFNVFLAAEESRQIYNERRPKRPPGGAPAVPR